MDRNEKEYFLKRLIQEIWEKHEKEKLSEFFHPDLKGFYNDDPIDLEILTKRMDVYQRHMNGLKIKLMDLIIEENSFAFRLMQDLQKEENSLSIYTILIGELKEGKVFRYYLKTEMPLEFNN